MEAVHNLLRTVVRGFYDIRAVIILDTLLTHHVLSDRELVSATGIPAKDVRATCARMREDHILMEIQHKDGGTPGIRAYTQTVYYIHFTEAVDAIKWKMHVVENKLREELDHKHNSQDYKCDVCGSKYDTMDALTLFDPETQQFLCATCNNPLREDNAARQQETDGTENDNQMEELMVQLKPLIIQLKKIDELTIPENTFESELQQQVPLIGVESSPSSYLLPGQLAGRGQGGSESEKDLTIAGSANSRLPQQVQSTFQVHITSEAEEKSLQESALAEKERLSKENALPDWHAHSTIGSNIPAIKKENNAEGDSKDAVKVSAAKDTAAENAMEEYFKKLQQSQGQDQNQNDDFEEEEEEDEFEDVV